MSHSTKTAFFDLDQDQLVQWCDLNDLPSYTAGQIQKWVYQHGCANPQEMSNLRQSTRNLLAEKMVFLEGQVTRHQHATDGTQKLLVRWPDTGDELKLGESVMIPDGQRTTACLSSQIGCPVGCRFCASGLGGLEGNLTAGRIIEQVYHLTSLTGRPRITHVVFMGMGEPLANFASVTKAIKTINASWGFGIGARRITVSTVGLPVAIRRLAEFDLPITLALSLHAPNDELRRELIPWAEYATISELLDACQEYFRRSGREITLEYLLLGGVNDFPEHARELAVVAKQLRANINLIRYNEVKGLPYERPATDDVLRFQEILRGKRVNAHIRKSRGRDIAAACGQLRRLTQPTISKVSRNR